MSDRTVPAKNRSYQVDGRTVARSAIPDSGIARWTFDDEDTDGSTAIDVWHGNDGTISGATTGVSGANQTYDTGEAYSFETDDIVETSTITNPDTFSFAVWVNRDSSFSEDRVVMSTWAGSSTRHAVFGYLNGGGKLRLVCDIGGDVVGVGTSASSASVDGWVHLIATHDGSTAKIYRDGAEVASGSLGSRSTDTTFKIGAEGNGTNHFNGDLDDPRYYAKALTATEASDLYNTGSI